MACKCQKPCKKEICCSICPDVKNCEHRCKTCAPKEQVKKEEPKTSKED